MTVEDADLDALEAAARGATQGRWRPASSTLIPRVTPSTWVAIHEAGRETRIIGACNPADAAYIAAAEPTVVLALINALRVERARARDREDPFDAILRRQEHDAALRRRERDATLRRQENTTRVVYQQPGRTEPDASDPYTLDLRLCDDAGLTDIDVLNRLSGLARYTGAPFPCMGSAHLGGQHVRCTSPAHAIVRAVTGVPVTRTPTE